MCRKKRDTMASTPKSRSKTPSSKTTIATITTTAATTYSFPTIPSSNNYSNEYSNNLKPSSSSSNSIDAVSLASIKHTLNSHKSVIYPFSEISSATNNFLSSRLSSSSSSSSWRCNLQGKDVVVFQRRLQPGSDLSRIPDRLSSICRGHHIGLVRLLGASVGDGDSVYLVYEYVPGATLENCLRNPKNPNFSLLPTWVSRIQVAADVAETIYYIHDHSRGISGRASNSPKLQNRPVHNRIKSSSVIVTEPDFRAKICHYGTAEIIGEIKNEDEEDEKKESIPKRTVRIEGRRGYMAPEIIAGESPSQKSDVFAFGVVLLELVTGEEPLKYRREKNKFESFSLVNAAREVVTAEDEEQRRQRVRRWLDPRMRDSFPVDVAEKVVALAVDCVHNEKERRPEMVRVAGKLSRWLLRSKQWDENIRVPTEISVSMAPR